MDQLKPIHTLNARGHLFLEVVRDYLSLDSEQMNREIRALRNNTVEVLKTKGVDYISLKSALVPDPHRKEIAFVFDTFYLQDVTWYGLSVFEKIMPLIDKRSSHSFLMGDFIGNNSQQDELYDYFCEVFIPARDFIWRHSGLLYIVYINNLSDEMVDKIHDGLSSFLPYAGFADCTYYSRFKRHISFNLCNTFVKYKNIVVQSHEDDVPDTENQNTCGYPFEKFGYKNRSLNSISFGIFLSYKIERPIYKGFETDEEFSLNYISTTPSLLKNFEVNVDDGKIEYLRKQRGDTLKRANLEDVSSSELALLITSKISENYIYSMQINEYGDKLFNVVIEVPSLDNKKTRLLCGLKLKEKENVLFLITIL